MINNNDNCRVQGLTTHFFFLNSILWTAAFALTIFFVAVPNKKVNEVDKYEKYFHIAIWTISLMFTIPLLFFSKGEDMGSVSDTALWCSNSQALGKYRLFFFYVPVWSVFFFNIYVYFMAEKNNINNDTVGFSLKKAKVKRSDIYLIVFFFTW